jgi:hypothetical protein
MATLLPAISPSLFNASFINIPYVWPGVSLPDDVSNSISVRSPSSGSFISTTSARPSSVQGEKENGPPQPIPQATEFTDDDASYRTTVRRLSTHASRKSSWGTSIPPPIKPGGQQALEKEVGELEEIDLDAGHEPSQHEGVVGSEAELENGIMPAPFFLMRKRKSSFL